MLDQILHQIQDFEHRHGRHPSVIFVNRDHYAVLRETYPEIFHEQASIMLGFAVRVVPNEVLARPEVAWMPLSHYGELTQGLDYFSSAQPILQDQLSDGHALH